MTAPAGAPALSARIVAAPQEIGARGAGLFVVVPGLARFAPAEREVVALLPVLDINAGLAAGAGAFASMADRADICAGLMAADPFLVVDELAAALRRAGFRAVANFPSVGLIDGEAGAGLAAVGRGFEAELRTLAAFRALGFGTHVYVTDGPSAAAAVARGHDSLVVHPAFRPTEQADAALASAAAAAPGARLLRHAPASQGDRP